MKAATTSRPAWVPEFFRSLEANLATPAGQIVASNQKVKMIEVNGNPRVFNLSQAASKWRVAKCAQGLAVDLLPEREVRGEEDSSEYRITESLRDSYSAQLLISLSVFAFEAYARCFGRDWKQHSQVVFTVAEPELAGKLRSVKAASEMKERIIEFLTNESQKQRTREFFNDKRDDYLYDVCHFIRHGYAHGVLRGYADLVDLAPDLRNYILSGIQDHAEQISLKCVKQA